MKIIKGLYVTVFAVIFVLVSCNNELVENSTQKVDIASYVAELTQDYNQASLFHSALMSTTSTDTSSTTSGTTTTTGNDGTGHSSHHIVGLKKVSSVDISYNKLMFAKYDSLFSEHYFKYCIDMLKNDLMIVDSMGLMVNTTTMSGGTMMNGGNMGSMMDKNKMLSYMDSMHISLKKTTNPNYLKVDSIMHDHMVMSKTMMNQTDSIENVYGRMLILRRNHKLNH